MKANLIIPLAYYCASVVLTTLTCFLVTFVFRRDLFYLDFLMSLCPVILKVSVLVPILYVLSRRKKVRKNNSLANDVK